MEINGFHINTQDTLTGPYHVGTRHDGYWYTVHIETGRSTKVGPVRGRGFNNYEKAHEMCEVRNSNLAKGLTISGKPRKEKKPKKVREKKERPKRMSFAFDPSATVKRLDIMGASRTPLRVLLLKAGTPSPNFPNMDVKESEHLVEFYDSRYPHTPDGQFISRYYLSTLQEPGSNGLDLHGGEPEWRVSPRTLALVLAWAGYHNYFFT